MEPFVKWVGGKRQLMDKISVFIEKDNYKRLVEPFVGGGSIFLYFGFKENLINDINKELIETYKCVKTKKKDLMQLLNSYEENHSESQYLELRRKKIENMNNIEISSRFIYLNKAGFNGLYRVNSKGEFNVPFGKKEKVNTFSKKNIDMVSNYLNESKTEILNIDFSSIFKMAKKGDLFFIDPPYDKLDEKYFVNYQKHGFDRKSQEDLLKEIINLDNKNISFILTNSNTEWIKKSYKNFYIYEFNTNRMINSDSAKRINGAKELIITNIKLSEDKLKEINFLKFLNSMKSTNKKIDSLVDWKKVKEEIISKEFLLNELNFLISKNKTEFKEKLKKLIEEKSESIKLIPLLLAEKNAKKQKLELIDKNNLLIKFDFNDFDFDKTYKFINESNLINIFINKEIKILKDYFYGVEVGLDSNARKNRYGKIYSNQIEEILNKYKIKYSKEYKTDIHFKKNKNKKFDYFFNMNGIDYFLEINFYNTSGSKLDSIAGEYIELNKKVCSNGKSKFIWVTDGQGWKQSKDNLKRAFKEIPFLFNTFLFEEWIKNNS